MVLVTSTGYGRAVGVFDLAPEFPVEETSMRTGQQSPLEAGVWQRRQEANSVGDVDLVDHVRQWRLNWRNATRDEANRLRELHQATRGRGGLLLYYPPQESDASNLCPSPENFRSPVWKRLTTDTSVDEDATASPSVVAGSSYLLRNAGGASEPAGISAKLTPYPSTGTVFAGTVYVQRPSSNPSGYATIRFRNATTGDTDFATYAWNGSAWAFDTGSSDGVAQVVPSGAWTRIAYISVAGTEGGGVPVVGTFPEKRYLEVETGKTGAVEAGKDLLIAGAQLEETKSATSLTGAGQYNSVRRHVLVRIIDEPLRIERWGPRNYRMSVTLEEVPSAP